MIILTYVFVLFASFILSVGINELMLDNLAPTETVFTINKYCLNQALIGVNWYNTWSILLYIICLSRIHHNNFIW